MAPDQMLTQNVVRRLIEGTNNGTIQWASESIEGDSFRATLNNGGVRVSRVVEFPGLDGPIMFELLDPYGTSIFQFRPHTDLEVTPVKELFHLARRQALNLDQTIGALIEEIESRTKR